MNSFDVDFDAYVIFALGVPKYKAQIRGLGRSDFRI